MPCLYAIGRMFGHLSISKDANSVIWLGAASRFTPRFYCQALATAVFSLARGLICMRRRLSATQSQMHVVERNRGAIREVTRDKNNNKLPELKEQAQKTGFINNEFF